MEKQIGDNRHDPNGRWWERPLGGGRGKDWMEIFEGLEPQDWMTDCERRGTERQPWLLGHLGGWYQRQEMRHWERENLLGRSKDDGIMNSSLDILSMRKLPQKRMNLSMKEFVETRGHGRDEQQVFYLILCVGAADFVCMLVCICAARGGLVINMPNWGVACLSRERGK